ncbi:C-signal isoform X2 [Cylas formicarius]|uniref:C-signal isoform X2 n=1 Tax=Cylas formicarius TaxID=197179 RepID=UPI002958AFDC|nr:C-signal isoform X2 [Cylas formicarius]
MRSILATGCNRGLGLGLIRRLVKEINPPKTIVATCRDIAKAKELGEIAQIHKNVHILELDVQNVDKFSHFSKEVERIVGDNGLNVLFNNAGYSPKSTRINFVKADQLTLTFAVNVAAPILLTKVMLPLLKKASASKSSSPLGSERAAIVNMSSVLGSITLNKDGGLYAYRCSKAALNMATKSMSIDLKNDGILVTAIHPGWVKTDMGGSNAPLTVDESITGILKVLRGLSEEHNGRLVQWDGQYLAW